MTKLSRSLTLLLLVGVAACSARAGGGPPPAPAAAGPDNMSVPEMEAVYRARQDSARMRFTDADVQFMNAMIHHHAQALEMSRLAPKNGASESLQVMAARIINAQRDEIALMQTWLRQRGQPVPELHITDDAVMVHGGAGGHGHDHTTMTGMLSPAQMAQLRQARGREFDRLFLTFMIEHHRGAVEMVRELFTVDGAGQDDAVFRIASDIHADQSSEIQRMERMLAALQ